MQKNTENKVLAYCRRHKMFLPGEKVVLGVSGGADSVCLLFVLLHLREELGIRLYVVHVNHGVREDAGEDAAYVESLCRDWQIPFLLEEISMEELAGQWGVSSEEAGRIARYQAFDKACALYGCNKIAVAHNSNDRAETMLFHLFRGTGLKGLTGIPPVRENVVRPLLCLERDEIEEYLQTLGVSYREDSTNDSDAYTRNRIRHHILPYAEEHVVSAAVANMNRTAEMLAEEENYLEEQTRAAAAECCMSPPEGGLTPGETGEMVVSVEKFMQQHPVIQKRLLLMLLKELSPRQQDITAGHVEDIRNLFLQKGNRQIHLPYGIRGERRYTDVWLLRRTKETHEDYLINVPYPENPEEGCLFHEGHVVHLSAGSEMIFTVLEKPRNPGDIPENLEEIGGFSENQYTKWFDYDKIEKSLQIRTRRTGDYLTIRGNAGDAGTITVHRKRVKDYMITEKIPREERDRMLLLADGDHILWIPGYRISEYYKVTENTKRILKVQLKQNEGEYGKEKSWQNV